MKHFNSIIFLRQDIFKISTFIFWILSLLSGGTIIFSMECLGGRFSVDNIYAMFSTISEFLILFVAANLFGKEFTYRTINMIRICNRSNLEILARKWAAMMIVCMLTAFVSFVEVAIFAVVFDYNVGLGMLELRLVISYCIYGTFVYALATTIVMLAKNTLHSFIILFVVVSFAPMIMHILLGVGLSAHVMELIPFTFMRDAFSFARYSDEQIVVMVVWSIVLLILSNALLKKRGYV